MIFESVIYVAICSSLAVCNSVASIHVMSNLSRDAFVISSTSNTSAVKPTISEADRTISKRETTVTLQQKKEFMPDVQSSTLYKMLFGAKNKPTGVFSKSAQTFQNTKLASALTGKEKKHKLTKRRVRSDASEVTKPEDYPYAVMIFIFDKSQYLGLCSGSIVSLEWVLTAATHCFRLGDIVVSHVEVYAGGNSEREWLEKDFPSGHQLRISTEIHVHPNYFREENYVTYHDVALVRVDKFTRTKEVAPVRIHTRPWAFQDFTSCVVTGFGKRQFGDKSANEFVRRTHYLEVKSPCPCLNTNKTKRHNWICSKPEKDFGICESDWGAALVCEEKISALAVVVISYQDLEACVKDDYSNYYCAQDNSLSIFQNTFPCIAWMNESLKRFEILRNKTQEHYAALGLHLVCSNLLIPCMVLLWMVFNSRITSL